MTDSEDGSLAISEDLVQSPTHKPASTTTLDFNGLLTTPLRLHEDLADGCGGQLWPAGMVLAKYILQQHKTNLKGKTMFVRSRYPHYLSAHKLRRVRAKAAYRLELGAGGGLVGLAVSLGCDLDRPLYITDQSPMLALMRRNITLNNLQDTVRAEVLDWGAPLPPSVPQTPDFVLAADCVYFEPAFPLLQTTLLELIGPDTVCYFCFKKRRRADLQFLKKVRKVLEVREVGDDADRESYARENIFLYVF